MLMTTLGLGAAGHDEDGEEEKTGVKSREKQPFTSQASTTHGDTEEVLRRAANRGWAVCDMQSLYSVLRARSGATQHLTGARSACTSMGRAGTPQRTPRNPCNEVYRTLPLAGR